MTIHKEYFKTRFKDIDSEVSFPDSFAIITGYATTKEVWSKERNNTADKHLLEEIQSSGHWHTRITGFVGDHTEPGWAVTISLEEAIQLGAKYKQDAIYYVNNDSLSVHVCVGNLDSAPVGSFKKRIEH